MQSEEIRRRFIEFFKARGHSEILSASLVPDNDPSVLFTTAGMQPLVPYLLGQPHPMGKRLVSVQKCVRTQDIDEVGDNTHDTFFEMLGNWSLGDYFKEDAIKWSYELLTNKEEGFGLDPKRLYVTVFEGDENAPRDEESATIWKSLGMPEHRIYYRSARDNWWSPGPNGPCGPDTEMFYDITKEGLGDLTPEQFQKADDDKKVIEIWNDVFMEYEKRDNKVVGKLAMKNVDTGAGLERLSAVLQKTDNVFATDLFAPIMAKIDKFSTLADTRAKRIVADHVRTSVFMIADGVLPSNTDRGYILRRLLRRAVRYADVLGSKPGSMFWIAETVIEKYKGVYPEVTNALHIKKVIDEEESKFRKTLEKGIKEFEKIAGDAISGEQAFALFSTYGFPIDLTEELAKEKGVTVDRNKFDEEFKKHQDLSRSGAAQKFAGGLADHSVETVRLHTAHHLLLAALQKVLGKSVKQRGSNITSERLRIDFSFDRKLTTEELKQVEDLVNQKISEKLPMVRREMPKAEAEQLGAEMEFGVKYGEQVSVYGVQEPDGSYFSLEFCGGPHVSNTGELTSFGGETAKFKIIKEEASSQGVRRIKAILE